MVCCGGVRPADGVLSRCQTSRWCVVEVSDQQMVCCGGVRPADGVLSRCQTSRLLSRCVVSWQGVQRDECVVLRCRVVLLSVLWPVTLQIGCMLYCEKSLFVACLPPQQHACVSQGRISSDSCTCCHTETEVADQAFCLIQSQYADTGPTSLIADRIAPDIWQDSHWCATIEVSGIIRPGKRSTARAVMEPRSAALVTDALP